MESCDERIVRVSPREERLLESLRSHAGKWIAVLGSDIIAFGSEFKDMYHDLWESGRHKRPVCRCQQKTPALFGVVCQLKI